MPYRVEFDNPFVPDADPEFCVECRSPVAEERMVWHPLCRVPAPLTDLRERWVYEPGWRCADRGGCLARQNACW